MNNKIISQEAYDILISKSPSERAAFLSKAIIGYQGYLDHTFSTIRKSEKTRIKRILAEMIKNGEVSGDFVKNAIYELDKIENRQEEIDFYVNCLQ